MKLILARRDTFLYKQSGVVANCKRRREKILLKINCNVHHRKADERHNTYQGDEKDDEKAHGAHRSAQRRNESHENFWQRVADDDIIRNHCYLNVGNEIKTSQLTCVRGFLFAHYDTWNVPRVSYRASLSRIRAFPLKRWAFESSRNLLFVQQKQ